jgi:hypothetical protein
MLMRVARVFKVANRAVAMDAWARLLCYPRGSFYPLSPVPSTKHTGITMTDFRPCSTRWSHSQAPFCRCTYSLISIQAKGTFVRLRYVLVSNLPS